jgi:hypothetical protein
VAAKLMARNYYPENMTNPNWGLFRVQHINHSKSCNSFVFEVQASQRSPNVPSKTILLPNDDPVHFKQLTVLNNGPAITSSSFFQLPNGCPAKQRHVPDDDSALTILQICVPTITTSTSLQVSNNHHSILNDITSPQAFTATTAIIKAPQIWFNKNKLT